MATVYGAVRLDVVGASKSSNHLISFINTSADTQNGYVFHAEDLATGQREAFAPVQPTTASIANKSLYLNASVETTYLAGQTITDFVLTQNSPGRGVLLQAGDIVTITDNVITGTTVVGQYVNPANASWQLAINASAPTTKFSAKIIEKTTVYGQPATVIKVLSN